MFDQTPSSPQTSAMAKLARGAAAPAQHLRRRSARWGITDPDMIGFLSGSESKGPVGGARWVIMGERDMKANIYADKLSKLLDVPHICLRDLVRSYKQVIKPKFEDKSKSADVFKFELLSKRLEHGRFVGENGFILTGVPLNKSQAEVLDEITDINLAINFKRYVKTSHQSVSGSSWLDLVSGPKIQKKESATGDSSLDDKQRALADQARELENHYRKQKKLLNLQLSGGPSENWEGYIASMCFQHMDSIKAARLAGA